MEIPSFLYGCFDWRENGLHWNHAPEFDLLSDAALHSTNPWIVLAAVTERAKHGDHRHARRLQPFFHRDEPFALSRVSLLVCASVAASEDLPMLREVLESDDRNARCYAAEGAELVGQLSLVPAMLEAWDRAETIHERETVGFGISEILEPEPGEIANQVGIQDAKPPRAPTPDDPPAMVWLLEKRARDAREALEDPAPFPGLVTDAYEALRAKLGDGTFVWEAEPLSVSRVVSRLLTAAKQGKRGIGGYLPLRHRLEAWTGMDCRPFFYAGEPRRLEIAAALESFLESGELERYVPGQRYFWGHPVP